MKTIRIFISSPGDVEEERQVARQAIETLRGRYAGKFELKPVFWEDLALEAHVSFQQGIDRVLSRDRGVDIAIFILWSRLGSPLGTLILKEDGTEYRSGTEREFDLILQARKQGGGGRPKILAYTRKDEASFVERLRGKSTDDQARDVEQKLRVEKFIKESFQDKASGFNIGAYHSFDQPVTFGQRLLTHLRQFLDEMAGDFSGDPVWKIERQGSPFCGLEAFDFKHHPVFFGRENEVLEVRRALQKKAEGGCAFVLISGASGSGKSSLARAGVMPEIVACEVDNTVVGWRHAALTPTQLGANQCLGLARRLCAEEVLPELRVSDDSVKVLAEGLAVNPKLTVDQSLRPALERAKNHKTRPASRLLLLVDQLEELFGDKQIGGAGREQLINALDAMARSGAVWVLATVRADFYQHCQRLPVLMRMKDGPGQVDLLAPAADGLHRLIDHPARLAGLRFEEKAGASLADRILADAAQRPELLPLVSFVLRELFEQRTGKGVLTFAAYEQLGGVEGALARRAEAEFNRLPAVTQKELPAVLRMLVSVSGDGDDTVIRQWAPLENFVSETPARDLVDRFVQERFLVAGQAADGKGSVTVAHEALLRVWNRAAQWIGDNREFLRVRARVAARMKEGSRLLEGDPLLEAARHHLAILPGGFTNDQAAFIADCVQAAQQARQKRVRRLRQWLIAVGLLALVALFSGLVAWLQKNKALDAAIEAKQALAKSDYLLATDLIEGHMSSEAIPYLDRSLALNPASPSARSRLCALLSSRLWMLPSLSLPHSNVVWSAQFSPDGGKIVTASWDDTARVWDAQTGHPLTPPLRHQDFVWAVQFSPDGKRVVTGSYDGTARVWDAASGQPVTPPMRHGDRIWSAVFSPDGKRVLTGSADHTARVWDAVTGQAITPPMNHGDTVLFTEFSPDGTKIVTCSWDKSARVWDAQTGLPLTSPLVHGALVNSAHFSPDGKRLVTDSWDGTAQIWDATTGLPQASPFRHSAGVLSAEFSPDGRKIITASADQTAQLWNAFTGQPLLGPLIHNATVNHVHFSPDGRSVLSASADNLVILWDASTGHRLVEPLRHSKPVNSAVFSPDGKRVLTASDDRLARLWSSLYGTIIALPLSHPGAVASAQFSPDGHLIVVTTVDGSAYLWDSKTGRQVYKLAQDAAINSTQFSPDGRYLVTASDDNTARIWNTSTGEKLAVLEHHEAVTSAEFSPDCKRVVTVSADGMACIWNAGTGQPLTPSLPHGGGVSSAEFSPDGQLLVTVARDNTVRVWEASTGKLLTGPLIPGRGVVAAQFSPDSQRIVTVSLELNARVWEARSGKELVEPLQHGSQVTSARFSPDGRRIVTSSLDHTAKIWDANTGQMLLSPLPHNGPVINAQFSPDGHWIATASADGTARIWDSETGKPLTDPMPHRAAVIKAQFSPDSRRLATISANLVRIWDVVPASADCPDWLGPLGEAVSGERLSARNVLEPADQDRFQFISSLRKQLDQIQTPDDWTLWGRWLLADPAARTISPFATQPVSEYVENRLRENSIESLDEAEALSFGNTSVLRRIAEARDAFGHQDP